MKQHPLVRKLLALALSLLLLLTFMPTVLAEESAESQDDWPIPSINVTNEQELRDAILEAADGNPRTIVIPETGITLTNNLEIKVGDVTLEGGPLTTDPTKTFGYATMILVSKEGRLHLKCELLIAPGTTANGVRIVNGGMMYMYDGAKISGGNLDGIESGHEKNGGGVQVRGDSSYFVMYGGEISGNTAQHGGGVQVSNEAKFSMVGGVITGNTATGRGGGIALEDTLTEDTEISNATITGNTAPTGPDIRANGQALQISGDVTTGEVEIGSEGNLTIDENATLTGDVTVSDNWTGGDDKAIQNNGTLNGDLIGGSNVVVDNGENGQITGEISEGVQSANPGEKYTITVTQGANGTIAPSTASDIAFNASQRFTITANSGYHVADVLVDGQSVGAVTEYTFNNINSDHTISATFAADAQPEPSKPSTSFTEPSYYPDYDEDVEYLPPVEDEEEPELYMVTCRTLNVRMGPGTSYAKLGTLSRGTLVSGELENGWVKFTYNGVTAYSSADYLMKVDGDLSGLHVTCRTLNVRAGAGTEFQILGTLSRGTEISVRDVLPGWYEIDFLGGIGYVSAAYIG